MAIIISENGKSAQKVDPSNFELEEKIQTFIYENPETIPLYEIDNDTRLFIAAREFSTKSGSIDALGFDASGNIYVVETKLYNNPDKRKVVAQALDYGASLWRHSTNFDAFIQQLDAHTQKKFGTTFEQKYLEFFSLEDASTEMSAIHSNLAEGSIKFVVLMDRLHDGLKDLVVFINQNSKFDLYAVELEYYKHKEYEIVIPKLYGAEVKKEVSSTRASTGTAWLSATEEEFLEALNGNFTEKVISKNIFTAVKTLCPMYRQLLVETLGGNVRYYRKKYKTYDVVAVHFEDSAGKVAISIDTLAFFSFWRYKKTGAHVDFMDKLLQSLVSNGLFDKGEGWLKGYDWYSVNLSKSNVSDADIKTFININQQLLIDL